MRYSFVFVSFYLTRVLIVFLWLALIGLFLYSPYLNYWSDSKNSLNVYTWADMIDLQQARDFEKTTGIKVNLVYYDNSEELIAKLEISKGRGYDVVVLGDSNIPEFIKLDLLAPLDYQQLNFSEYLEPKLLNQNYDPNNIYSLPYSWDIYGMGINISKLDSQIPASWSIIFDGKLGINNIGMMEEALRAISLAAQYLYGKVTHLDTQQKQAIKDLLIKQKKMVTVYTELLGDYLLFSGASPAVASQAAYVARTMKINPDIRFVIPQEGGFIATENFAVLKASNKKAQAYEFINFMYQKDRVNNFVNKTGFLPARTDVLQQVDLAHFGSIETLLSKEVFNKIDYFRYIAVREEISQMWIEVKAS